MNPNDPFARELQRALDSAVEGVPFRDLRQAARLLSECYRADSGARLITTSATPLGPLAYAATRMPATLAAARAVLRELRLRSADVPVRTLLDIGAGPATTLWAAASEFPELSSATLVEPERAMADLATRLLEGTSLSARVETRWHVGGSPMPLGEGSHDLVVAGYVLTEVDPPERVTLVEGAWRACRSGVAVILPGSAAAFRVLLDVRQQLLDLGATIVAPCPHQGACPMSDADWCHFGVRLNRSSLHRRLKGGTLPYEDEKYSYVVATRGAGTPAETRVISRPVMRDRRVTLRLCAVDGLRDELIPRSDRQHYRRARKTLWGEAW